MKVKKFFFYLLAALMGGCVLSLHPLYTEKDLIFEEKLLGTWAEEGSKETWQFKRANDNSDKHYEMIYTDKEGKKGRFDAGLGKLNNMMFLNICPKEPELSENDFYKFHILPVNSFIKIEQIQPTLEMRVMDPCNLKEMLENDPNLIKHEIVHDRLVLTASTKELQEFLKAHANDEGLFGEPSKLKRVQPKDPNAPESTKQLQ
ncbi:MAG: hypothetical protein WAV28_05995 [Sedimentisphaerales bacterium]|jgi:hypothetical protein